MTTVTVRVIPRSRSPGVDVGPEGIAIRVRAPAEAGRATEEARRALAAALGVPARAVALRTGARSRVKAFQVEGLTQDEAARRLRAG